MGRWRYVTDPARSRVAVTPQSDNSHHKPGSDNKGERVLKFPLRRYRIDPGPSIHRSSTAEAVFACDYLDNKKRVCVKKMTDKEQFRAEIDGRFLGDGKEMLDANAVIEVLRWHTPRKEQHEFVLADGRRPEEQSTDNVLNSMRQLGRTVSARGSLVQDTEPTPEWEWEHFCVNEENHVYPYVLVMELGERSLHDACARERIAGIHLEQIRQAAKSVAECLQLLHETNVCHCDVKQRNIIRLNDEGSGKQKCWHQCPWSPAAEAGVRAQTGKWVLCDMDGATHVNKPISHGGKFSTAYCPPELAIYKFAKGPQVIAHPKYDVWSFGVVLYELCSGQTLFSQDISNDEVINAADQTRLCTWHCAEDSAEDLRKKGIIVAGHHHHRVLSDEELEPVFSMSHKIEYGSLIDTEQEQAVLDAKNLIRWCLNGRASSRPTIDQVLNHRFLDHTNGAEPAEQTMRYHAFMSHSQADSSGLVNTLFFAYAKLGLHNWIDMRQDEITLQGMRDGVVNSNVFMLALSERVLSSWYAPTNDRPSTRPSSHTPLNIT